MVLRGVSGPNGFYYSGKIPRSSKFTYANKAKVRDIGGRSRGKLISIDMDVFRNTGIFRDATTGRFISPRSTGINQTRADLLAQQLQDLMVQNRQQTVRRPRVSTGRLDKALLDRRNRVVTATAFGVGVPTFLNQQAPYWRAIEQGTSYFVGRRIVGVFGESLTGQYAAGARYGAYPIAGDRYTRIGAGTGGRLIPSGAMKQAGITFADADGAGSARTGGRITKPIAAQRYMQRAWRTFNPRQAALDLARDALFKALLRSRNIS